MCGKVLDYFQLPNTFSILFTNLTHFLAYYDCYHRFVVLLKRHRQVARAEQRSGSKTLSEEEKAKIEPISEASGFLSSFPVLAVVFFWFVLLFEPFQIPSGSMGPHTRWRFFSCE